ncbi:MAG: hypothetical protein QOG23_257 [Blastocatellia bacterium]|jgi:hypothetical protein|nr:hypothetical protein [Blastocatellia bacterium]
MADPTRPKLLFDIDVTHGSVTNATPHRAGVPLAVQ